MNLKMYSFRDSGVDAFTQPFFMHNDGQAIRAFQDNVNSNDENNIAKHPEQFTLFCIGEFDDNTGQMQTYEPAKALGNGLTFKIESQERLEANQQIAFLERLIDKVDAMEKIINSTLGMKTQ